MYTLALHIEECQRYMSSPKQYPLTCLRGSTSLQAKANATEKERVICANLRSQGNHLWTWLRYKSCSAYVVLPVNSRFAYLNGGRGIRPPLKAL